MTILSARNVVRLVRLRWNSTRPHCSRVRPIETLLVANRGEIACRVMKTAKRMGIKTVAIYSDADRDALHVRMADEARRIGPAPVEESYLRGDRVLDVAKSSKATAIHPGYGFLSENVEFAQLCQERGVIFVGPPVEAIRSMGIKSKSKEIMINAGVPVIKGYHGVEQSDETLSSEADKIGYPIMIKAVRGGGGKGMRIALNREEFAGQLASARRESLNAFGNDEMLIEKFVGQPRHVEVQVFGDQHGNYVYLFERDCSVQRRHQKIIEEAPAPGVDSKLRQELGEAAVRAARAVEYAGAGTVEFLFDRDTSEFYFMEMNTRLQVEHPITEMITGVDLVEWQLRVAGGEKLPLTQDEIRLTGHSFEGRVYAEDTRQNFIPAPGPIRGMNLPSGADETDYSGKPLVRIETGVRAGDEISVHYDPMIAKVVAWGHDRSTALAKLKSTLAEFNMIGLKTNTDFLLKLCAHPQFKSGDVHTNFIDEHREELMREIPPPEEIICAATFILLATRRAANQPVEPSPSLEYFRLFDFDTTQELKLICGDDEELGVTLTRGGSRLKEISLKGATIPLVDSEFELDGNSFTLNIMDKIVKYPFLYDEETREVTIFTDKQSFTVREKVPDWAESAGETPSGTSSSDHSSPMPGVIQKVLVSVGDEVAEGQPLVVMIAMKMEYVINASRSGRVTEIFRAEGENVPKGVKLVHVE